jgi:dTDP-4-amino-4,6-dideoxygalactose transaminase
VFEDNAQAIDAHGDTFRIGQYSAAVGTSFIIQKNLGTFGDGGAVLTDDAELALRVRRLRNHGSLKRSVHSFGFNSRLDDIHAGILSVKLKHITEWSDRRREIAAMYSEGLRDSGLILPCEKPGYRHVYHLYVVHTPAGQRDELLKYLNDNGVDAKLHYPIAIHQQEGFPWGKPCRIAGDLKNTEFNAANCISLPMFPELTQEEIDYTIQTTLEGCRKIL